MSTFYIVGSGPTLDYVDPDFFIGSNVIAVNRVAERLNLYSKGVNLHTFSHYHGILDLAEKYHGHRFHLPEGDRGFKGEPPLAGGNVTFYPHYPTRFDFDASRRWPDGGILVGSTSAHGAMHLACKLGASSIILVGVDCGLLDGKTNHGEYVSGNLAEGDVLAWLGRWDKHLREVKRVLVDEYGVRIYSLNPFVNLNLEGHKWTGVTSDSTVAHHPIVPPSSP